MRSNKRYSNVTFTKRVDHEAGRHRPPRAATEPRTCERCHAVYRKRRWTDGAAIVGKARATSTHGHVLCPACLRILTGPPGGYVRVAGTFAAAHRPEVERLLQNEAARAAEDNPTARVMSSAASRTKLELTTTTPHLAQRLGHALQKAYGGTLRYNFSHENEVTRVVWSRNEK